ncbi:MAG: tetratricopeptide repeat protein [Candidatus Hodarchaeales archaeon]|jgi:tetratricopeptide (TPR) repeat protein
MKNSVQENLKQVEQLLKQGEYKNALEVIEELSSKDKITGDDKIASLLLECRIRTKLGEFKKAQVIVEELISLDRKMINSLQVIDAYILNAEISWRLGNLEEGLNSLLKGEKLIQVGGKEKTVISKKKEILRHRGIIYWYMGKLDDAVLLLEEALGISREEKDKKGIADSLNNLGLIYQSKGEFSSALEYYQQSLHIYEDFRDKESIAKLVNNIGITYSSIGDQEKALTYFLRTYEIKQELGIESEIAMTLINLGAIYRLKGELPNALEHYQKGQKIYEKIKDKKGIALALNNLGDVYQLKGDINLALEYYQESLTLYEELGIKQDIAMSLINIGELYRKKRNPEWALKYYERSLTMYEELKNDTSAAKVLYELVLLGFDSNELELAEEHLENLKQIFERTKNKTVKHRYLIANALLLKSRKRTRHKMKAEELLLEVVEDESANHILTVTAMIHLCDLLLFELKMTGEDEILNEVKDLIEKLHNIAKKQVSHSLLIETYVLQSKLALLEMDVQTAKKLLELALVTAERKGLRNLAIKIYSEKTLLETQIEKWEYLVKQKAPLNERLELTRLEEMITGIGKERPEITEEEINQYSIRAKGITIPFEILPKRKYRLRYVNLLKETSIVEKPKFRVAIAQIGKSTSGDLLHEFYTEQREGLFLLKKELIPTVRKKVKELTIEAHTKEASIIIFPELAIDLNYQELVDEITTLANNYNMYIIPGSYHDQETQRNISLIIGPTGILWQQEKHIPAIIHYQGRRFKEGIDLETGQRETIVGITEYGTMAIAICRDFLDMDLRVELKNADPPVDLIFNPAFTPVTEDFKAVHFDARRSIFAYCFFANIAEIGNSFIFTPERERQERNIPPKEESIIYKDVDLFRLRSERKRWEKEHAKQRPFIQSTRV